MPRPTIALFAATAAASVVSLVSSAASAQVLSFVGRSPVLAGAEISGFDPASQRLFTVSPTGVSVLNLASPATPSLLSTITITGAPAGTVFEPNSVAVRNGVAAVAVARRNTATNAQGLGFVRFFDAATATQLGSDVPVGFLPDMITFTPDGSRLLTANEGEPNSYGQANSFDPEGSVSIIDISGGIPSATVQTAGFTSFNSQIATLRDAGVRIYGPGATVAQDLEPEYITVRGSTAYVGLQEANAIATVDIPTATVTAIRPLGLKNHNLPGNGLDASDQTPRVISINPQPVFGMYQPDAIDSYSVGGVDYLVTANEGDSRAYTGFDEEIRVNNAAFVLDPTVFPNGAALKANTVLGRLQGTGSAVTPAHAKGDTDGDGDIDRIQALGARSFSIWNAATGTLVWDSGDQFEQITAAQVPAIFNSDGTAATFDQRSDNKGPEPEAVVLAELSGRQLAFIGLERVGGIMVYDITNPASPSFLQYINTMNPLDISPEGLLYIPASDSPTGVGLVALSQEVSRTVAIFQVPEPASLAVVGGAAMLVLRRR